MRVVEITISFDRDRVGGYTDEFLAQLWHVCQANPADIGDAAAIDAAEAVKSEIVRRWLKQAPVALFNHQARHLRCRCGGGEC